MAQRFIDGPSENYLTIEEVSREIGRSQSMIRALIRKGKFPHPAMPGVGREPAKWGWEQVVFWHLRVKMQVYLRREKKQPVAAKKKPES